MCSWPRADFGSGPTRSMPIRSKGTSMMGNGINGLGGGVLGEVRWHVGRRGRSASPPHPSRASGSGRGSSGWYWGLLGGRPSDGSARAPSPSQSWAEARPAAVFPPPPRGDTVEQAILDDEVGDRVWRGWTSFPSVTLTWVQQCFSRSSPSCSLAKVPPPLTCWNTSKKRLADWEGDSPSRGLSEASRTGRCRGRRLNFRVRRLRRGWRVGWRGRAGGQSLASLSPEVPGRGGPSLGPLLWAKSLGGWNSDAARGDLARVAVDAGDRENGPGSWPRGNHSRLDQADRAAGVQEGPIGTPVDLHVYLRGCRGGSWCSIQPASQARRGAVGGSVGIGSSCGTGAAGLPTGLKVPSGERRSWGTLRGIGIRSPASRRWAASANSMASTSSPTVSGFRMPAACRMGRGSARSKRSTTTRSATWAALGSPARSQWRVRRDRSAAWARAGNRLEYSHSCTSWAAATGESPTRDRIFFLEIFIWTRQLRRHRKVGSLRLAG